jgi:RNA polymerase sigma-70 factor (ECF subfamily)
MTNSTAACEAGQDELITRVRAGDERACEQLVREHGPRMLAVARRFFACDDDAADAVQDAFISAFRSIHEFEGNSRLTTWLHRIVVNACLMKIRSRKEYVSLESLLPGFAADGHHAAPVRPWSADDSGDGFARASASETRAIVRSCIDRLPEPYRAVLILRDIEEIDTRDAARTLGCTVANVKTRLHRARQALRTLLDQRTLFSDA